MLAASRLLFAPSSGILSEKRYRPVSRDPNEKRRYPLELKMAPDRFPLPKGGRDEKKAGTHSWLKPYTSMSLPAQEMP
jgi:hypothetical protein